MVLLGCVCTVEGQKEEQTLLYLRNILAQQSRALASLTPFPPLMEYDESSSRAMIDSSQIAAWEGHGKKKPPILIQGAILGWKSHSEVADTLLLAKNRTQ